MTIKELLPEVKEDVSLAPYTTFKVGGPARYFVEAYNKEDLIRAYKAALEAEVPFFVLAGGSNVVVSDDGFPGMVILNRATDYKIKDDILATESGTMMRDLVFSTVEKGLSGLQWAGGLPGSVGGAIRGNAGAFGGEIKDNLKEVEYIDDSGIVNNIDRTECEFDYRNSIFKKNGWLVLSATFTFESANKEDLLEDAMSHVRYREERHPLEYPNAGSIFKNCPVEELPDEVADRFKDKIKEDPFPVLPVAVLVAASGLQRTKVGGAMVSEKHTNYIVNTGDATSKDIRDLISLVSERIKDEYGANLDPEVTFIQDR